MGHPVLSMYFIRATPWQERPDASPRVLRFMIDYPELLLLHEEHKRLIKVGVEVAHLDGGLLLLAYPLTLPVQQFYLHVGICGGEKHAHKCHAKRTMCSIVLLTDNTIFLIGNH